MSTLSGRCHILNVTTRNERENAIPDDAQTLDRHEILNLLMVIDLACDSLLQDLPAGSALRDDVRQIADAKARLLAILDGEPHRTSPLDSA